jgi:hypothetical protein
LQRPDVRGPETLASSSIAEGFTALVGADAQEREWSSRRSRTRDRYPVDASVSFARGIESIFPKSALFVGLDAPSLGRAGAGTRIVLRSDALDTTRLLAERADRRSASKNPLTAAHAHEQTSTLRLGMLSSLSRRSTAISDFADFC